VVKTDSIEALVRLLDDPDLHIFGHVRNRLLAAGPDALPYLKNSLDLMEMEAEAIDRIELLIQELHFLSVRNELLTWSAKSEKDLLKGAFLIARYQFPELEFAQLEEQICTIEQTVWLELNGKQTSFEITKTLNNVFFELYGFQGADKSHFTPYHSFLNTVLEEREGTPLSISILYSIVAQRLGIPIYGVSFPNHFLLAYMDEFKLHRLLQSEGSGGVLFYIDPYSKGEFLSKGNLEDAIQRLSLSPKRNYFEPASHSEILARMLNNLIHTYTQLNRLDKVQDLQALRACLLAY
jgi:regulator of sirC expression with transglutaminase-like and TPR domain